jgi:hypothetical protein
MFKIFTRTRGPIFNLRARMAARRGVEEAKREVADRGLWLIDNRLNAVLKQQTPYYRTQIRKDLIGKDWILHDGGVVYGAWLEGVSRRNQETRFKGYRTFRIIRNRLQEEAPDIADRVMFKYTREMQ